MARRRVRQSHLAATLGHNDQWLSVRLNGRTPIDLNDLAEIARGLSVDVATLLPNGLPTRQYLSRPTDRPQAATHRPPTKPGSRRPQRRNMDRITTGLAA